MRIDHFLKYVIRPVLDHLDMGGERAETLILGTALVESNLEALQQYEGGPARGVYQMEPATYNDIYDNYLVYRPDLAKKVAAFAGTNIIGADEMRGNLNYATAMARIHYRRVPEPLPPVDRSDLMAEYHKKYYNTILGKTDPAKSAGRFSTARGYVQCI